jgi:hypothetical protein
VSAAANAVFGGAQGASLLLGGLVAGVLSPRAIYAVAGLLGLAAAGIVAARTSGSAAYSAQRKPVASGRGGSGLAGSPPTGSSSL